MKKVLALIVCLLFALSVTAVFAADKAMDTKAPAAAADEKKMDDKKMTTRRLRRKPRKLRRPRRLKRRLTRRRLTTRRLTTRNSFSGLSCVDKRQMLRHLPFFDVRHAGRTQSILKPDLNKAGTSPFSRGTV